MLIREDALGHRKRLREKFLKSGLAGFQDYEIIELLLSLGTPRQDCKPQAKEAIRRFKNLRGVLEASPEDLQKIKGIGPHSIFGIKFTQAVAREFLKEKIMEKPICNSSQEIFDYFYHSLRDMKKEVVKVAYLNTQNQIIDVQDLSKGTVDSSAVYPREVMEGAIKFHAVSIVLVHNHPSGNPSPSESDRELTRELVYAGDVMQIRLLDHIIIGENRFFSFAGEGIIEKCETELLRHKRFNS
jgi:DNA repair protein RadC